MQTVLAALTIYLYVTKLNKNLFYNNGQPKKREIKRINLKTQKETLTANYLNTILNSKDLCSPFENLVNKLEYKFKNFSYSIMVRSK